MHPGEFGTYREAITKKFVRNVIPGGFEIDQGFVINSLGDISTQCDIVIYDSIRTPFIRSKELQRFFPVEPIAAIGEVKTVLTAAKFNEALLKLAKTKEICEKISIPSGVQRQDNISKKISQIYSRIEGGMGLLFFELPSTFLVCEKLDFDYKSHKLPYDTSIPARYRHNIILSIEDGLMVYGSEDGMHHLPTRDDENFSIPAFYQMENRGNDCFKLFLHLLHSALAHRPIVDISISQYMDY
jgi:hypothetical protein